MSMWLRISTAVTLGWVIAAGPCCEAQEPGDKGQETPSPAETPSVDPLLAEKLSSPSRTMKAFLEAMEEDRKDDAVQCLDLSQEALTEETRSIKGPEIADKLRITITRLVTVRYSDIEQVEDDALPFRLNYVGGLEDNQISDAARISIVRGEGGLWRFSAETVAAIDELYERWKDHTRADGLSLASEAPKEFPLWLAEQFPENLLETRLLLPDYQWLCILILIVTGFIADMLTRGFLNALTHTWFRFRQGEDAPAQKGFWRPVGLFVQAILWYQGTKLIGLPAFALTVLFVGVKLFAVVASVWMSFHFVDLIMTVLAKKAAKTPTKYDDLLIPLVSKSLKAFAFCVGVLVCAETFDLKITGLLAGLGLGGMALAFASKDAIANLFGSVTVLLDRPFEVGDWIVAEGVEGTVETVGFRSTRIRTFYNSLITLPNSRLTTALVDNMGRRRYRRIKAMLGANCDTTPEQMEAFCEGIRELIRRHPYTRKDYYHVYFNQFSASSLDILLYCFVECPDWAVELRERQRLFVDILKLAQRLGVSFAYPTQTLHVVQQEPFAGEATQVMDPARTGRQAAADIAGPWLSPDLRPGRVQFLGPIERGGDGGEGNGG